MNELLQQEIAPPVNVAIGGVYRTIAFPMAGVILYKQLTGDNLFDTSTWQKADLAADPERFLTLLWVGLHVVQDGKFVSQISLDELAQQIDYGPPAGELAVALFKALTRFMPVKKVPNDQAPAPSETTSDGAMETNTGSSTSGEPPAISELKTPNS